MIKTILLMFGICLSLVLGACVIAFIRKTRLGGPGGYKNKHHPK